MTIHVSKHHFPDKHLFNSYLDKYWHGMYANNGFFIQQFEKLLEEYFQVRNVVFTSSGTSALQLAIMTLPKGEIITTPYSFVATTSAIVASGYTPVFVDISPDDFNIDASKIAEKITSKTVAILATHIYGNACEVDKIESIAKQHGIKVIYDAAHCFGSTYKNRALVSYGDMSAISFHCTKIMHTMQGGAVITNDDDLAEQLKMARNFGINTIQQIETIGTNAKNSELHAIMGICNMAMADKLLEKRKLIADAYDVLLSGVNGFCYPISRQASKPNHSYYPLLFRTSNMMHKVIGALKAKNIEPRRYFSTPLNKLPYIHTDDFCPEAEDICLRILCLPSYHQLDVENELPIICETIKSALR